VVVSVKPPSSDFPMHDEHVHTGPLHTDLTLNKRLGLQTTQEYEKEFDVILKEQQRYFKSLVSAYIDHLEKNDD
jgi:hypothetical protein